MPDRTFGDIPGYPVGSTFPTRLALSKAGLHRQTQAGISGSVSEGADSIVLSGGYEDDEDAGDVILYTGEGGRDPATDQQVRHQTLTRGNLALAQSSLHGLPVRVIRKVGSLKGETLYRYDGLYRVDAYWHETGRSGFDVWRFRLVAYASVVAEQQVGYQIPQRLETSILRVVRDTEQARYIKKLYACRCQVCASRLETPAGPYAEAAHIRPLGAPHHGPDVLANLLCLCPNHHVLFDAGTFTLADDLHFVGLAGTLIVVRGHSIGLDYLHYHRAHVFVPAGATP